MTCDSLKLSKYVKQLSQFCIHVLFFFFKIVKICKKKYHQTILRIKYFGSLKSSKITFNKIELKINNFFFIKNHHKL